MFGWLPLDQRDRMADVAIRKATQTDAASIGALHVTSWRETYNGLLPDELLSGLSIDARTAMWAKILGKPEDFGDAAILVGEVGGHLVGFGACGKNLRDKALADIGYSGEIGAIYVLRSHQGGGIGRSLMAAMSHTLSAAGHTGLYLWVLRNNGPARAFYEKLGGIVVGEKLDEQPNITLIENAYGWLDLSLLAG